MTEHKLKSPPKKIIPSGGDALEVFEELTKFAVSDLQILAGLRELIDVGTPLFRSEIDHSLAVGAGCFAARFYASNDLHKLLLAARARNRSLNDPLELASNHT